MENYNVTIIIPCLNPDEKLLKTVLELRENGFDDFIIVNDGSDAKHLQYFPDAEQCPYCTVLNYRSNRGKGEALKSAFRYFLDYRTDKDGVITIDCDGQHLTKDIIKCAEALRNTDGVVLGCRDFSKPNVPPRSRFGNKLTRNLFKLFYGLKITDTQTGLRAIPTRYIETFLDVKGSRYEYESNMLLELKNQHLDFCEVEIDTVYIDNNSESHFRPIVDSFRIYKMFFTFAFSSLFSMLVEVVVFYLALRFFFNGVHAILWATVLSRVLSSVVNFVINKEKVFTNKTNYGRSIVRYIILAIPLLLASSYSIKGIVLLFGIKGDFLTTLVKMVVDTLLFFVSFRVQQSWVFASSGKKVPKKRAPRKARETEQKAEKITVGKIVKRTLLSIGTTVLYLVLALVVLLAVVARGPSTTLRDALVLSAKQASATKWVPGLFLPKETVQQIVDNSFVDSKLTINQEDYFTKPGGETDNEEELIDGLKYITERYTNFKAYIMLVPDPSRVYVATSSNNFHTAKEGKRIFAVVKQEDAIAAINGGEFADGGGVGTGAAPMGLTYSKGNCVWNESSSRTFIGIDKNNKLVISESMSKKKADEIGIRDAVCFQYGNVLIKSDDKGVNIHYKDKNTGAAQRTAIGQRADGTFIFVVTDGRTASSLGATYNEVIDIMVSYGAVNAAMLDGGSSAMMYYENYFDKYETDKSDLDQYQLQGLVNKYKAFTPPRRIPTFFCVSR